MRGNKAVPRMHRTASTAALAVVQATLWKIADAGHTGGLDAHPAEYEQRVVAFFDHALVERT